MPETLLTPSSIKLFGRLVSSLQFTNDTQGFGNNNFLQEQMVTRTVNIVGDVAAESVSAVPNTTGLVPGMYVAGGPIPAGAYILPPISATSFSISQSALVAGAGVNITATLPANFARIYAFSFEGAINTLPKPSMFLVHGAGQTIDITGRGKGYGAAGFVGRTTLDESGVIAREWEFSAADSANNLDLRYWEYEKGDFSMRLDTDAGPFEQILLAAALRAGADMADRSRSGMQLSGMQLSGMQLSGMQLGVNPNSRNGR